MLVRLALIALILIPAPARAIVQLSATGGLRSLSSQADNGGFVFVPETGLRLTLLDDGSVSPELTYGYTEARFSSIKVQDHAIQAGVRVTDGKAGVLQPALLGGFGYFLTRARATGIPDRGSSLAAIYGGAALSLLLGPLVFRADVTDNLAFSLKDSWVIVNLSAGVRF
jgi:hypothetical protein